ncbi:hypothetical protein EHEL_040440 [Encephalitozoon hellem ATCC 50504]|uniref:Uncharacterized protein n=1 Tax=Encephalitozoon hellem TaxID=27973 RepID=A0A9Q9F9B9_ENCHE|nr:uncharacterized protein EHEL_040440 [Encephalitozoon hellem ATCC 50504]AFM98095.1 hypothetical protein EHEL_040440 [Encephalitozoon hellem ATCC 50504]UTX42937.1 hypothetical protein GPU96_04g06680 [Encephalitozoon hellem]|eukprot:XP_003887076.1 hypothetical protein EHEL_040440 [Encephalitozoon hellem ATCC 50504]
MENKNSYSEEAGKANAWRHKMVFVRIERKGTPLSRKSNKPIYEYCVLNNKVTLLMDKEQDKILYECKRMSGICPEEEKEFKVGLGEDEASFLRKLPWRPYCSGLRKNIKKKAYTAGKHRTIDPATNLDFSSDESEETFF